MFANYSLGCDNEHRRVFATIRDYFLKYWEEEQFLVDYLLTDYLIVLAQRHDSYIDQAFKQIKPNNPMCDELFKILDEPYDALKWKALTKDTNLFKLTWKQQFKTSSNQQDTFFWKDFQAIGKMLRWAQNQFYSLIGVDDKLLIWRASLLGFWIR